MRLLRIHDKRFRFSCKLSLIHTHDTFYATGGLNNYVHYYVYEWYLREVSIISTMVVLPDDILSIAIMPPVYLHSSTYLPADTRRRYQMVVLLLERDANIHYNDDAALRKAVAIDKLDIIEALLLHGANVFARWDLKMNIECMYRDKDKNWHLHRKPIVLPCKKIIKL